MPHQRFGWLFYFLVSAAIAAEGLSPLAVDPALLGALPVKRVMAASKPAETSSMVEVSPVVSNDAPVVATVVATVVAPMVAPMVAPVAVPVVAPVSNERKESTLKTSRAMTPVVVMKNDGQPRPAFISADLIYGKSEVETIAEGEAEMRKLGTTINADRLTFQHQDEIVDAMGKVRLADEETLITGPHMRLRTADDTGFFENPTYVIKKPVSPTTPTATSTSRASIAGAGVAERLNFDGKNLFSLLKTTYSTCAPDNPAWYARAEKMNLDYNAEHGEATHASVHFQGVPILYSPWLSFSLNNQRKTGLLTPTYGTTDKTGGEIALPFYWNIAPNRDATITPRIMSRRGTQWNTEFRYLDRHYGGQVRYEYLPEDQLTKTRRTAATLSHHHTFGRGFSGNLELNSVSDSNYFTDLSSRLALISQSNLVRQGSLAYSGGWWNTTMLAQSYQTLGTASTPYFRLPQINLTASKSKLPMNLSFNLAGEYVNFDHATNLIGQRVVIYPQFSLPLQTPAFSVTPKLGFHVSRYDLKRQAVGTPDSFSRQVPIFSVDSTIAFERDLTWIDGKAMTQTLEPRLYYAYIPVRDQSQIPVFDSGRAGFDFAQIFTENRFGGHDRIGDANQATLAVTSKLLDSNTGAELLRGTLGQRFYFSDERVLLPGETAASARTDKKTDILGALSGRVLDKTWIDAAWQYSPAKGYTERFNVGGRYQPNATRVMNAAYRYTKSELGQMDVSGQWLMFGGWHAVGRYNYSMKEKRVIESIAGLEYDGGCWTARAVVQTLATQFNTITQKYDSTQSLFFQLELNGFSRIGSNPVDLLKRNVPGYGIINQPTADPVFGAR
ncbi:MAG: LPS-assembly protein LptD [Rhodocyclaceae bacterium]|nr:LPS-assembly protein LptD [Rhodocyclaceae bacterium]